MINKWKNITLNPRATLKDAMHALDTYGFRITLVAEEDHILLGAVTDGDIRRGLLRGLTLEAPIAEVMNSKPLVGMMDQTKEFFQELLRQHSLLALPIVDDVKKIVGLETVDSLEVKNNIDATVVLMAGGFGKRLYPLTEHTPKPMLPLGSKPILEHIISDFITQGFNKFYISLHYKSEIIKSYFKDGQDLGITIQYIEEDEPLGTAGVLHLLRDKISSPFIVMNADLLVKVNFKNLLDFHRNHQDLATICVRKSAYQVPYGVIELNDLHVKSICEKPEYSHFVNAGIYCFDKQIFDYCQNKTYLDMPTLFQKLIDEKKNVHAFPIHEYWIDIGRMDDYQKAMLGS